MKHFLFIVIALCLLAVTGMWAQGTVPPVPTDLTAQLGPDAVPVVKLGWNAPPGLWGYIVYRSVDDSLHFQKLAMVNTTVYFDHMVGAGHVYFYYVTSVVMGSSNRIIESDPSNIARVRIGDTPNRPIGIIAGTVTDDSTGKPIPGVRILFSPMRAAVTVALPSAITDIQGKYAVKLDTGAYKLKAEPAPWMPPGPPPYAAEWYDDKPDRASADLVPVYHNATTEADFGLSRVLLPPIPKGTITGKVIRDDTQRPIPGILIRFFKKGPVTINWQPVAVTDSMGIYTMVLDTGVYYVKTEHLGMGPVSLVHEWYDNVTDPSKATPVPVKVNTVFEANFGLGVPVPPTYATIEGYVLNTEGDPLPRATVVIMYSLQDQNTFSANSLMDRGPDQEGVDVEGVGFCRGVVWKGYADSLGYYKARVLTGRSYIAMASKWGYIPEYYDNKPNPLKADIIKVPTDIKSINFSLAPNPVLHNTISGLVRDAAGNEVPSIIVLFPMQPSLLPPGIRFGHTDSLGVYTIGDVVLGTYIVLAVPFGRYAPAFYKEGAFGVMHWRLADKVLVSGDVTGINIGVVPIRSLGLARLRGKIMTGTKPLAGVRVMASTSNETMVGYGLTDESGAYALEAIPAGLTTVEVDLPEYTATGKTVNVPQDEFEVNNVDFSMSPDATTGAAENIPLPESFSLNQNYPNPFNPSTTISFDMPVAGHATVTIFNTLGQDISTLMSGPALAGRNTITWNAEDNAGRSVASGVYFYRLTVTGVDGKMAYRAVQKMMLLR